MNRVVLVGEVAKLPFYHTTEKAAADLAAFDLKTQLTPVTGSEPSGEDAAIHRCVAWGPNALALHSHLKLRSQLAVRGRIQYHQFINKAGILSCRPEIVVEDFTFLDSGY